MFGRITWKKNFGRSENLLLNIPMSLWLVLIRRLNLLIGYFFLKDTEFPGIVVRPLGEFKTTAEYQYQCLKLNVDFLKIIQLGFTFMDSQGKSPPGVCSYQFNFNFNLT